MQSSAQSVDLYLQELPEERKAPFMKLRQTILENIPSGFEEVMSYGMIGYVVPHHTFPAGYHCNPKLSLPFVNLASQKNFIALYHMGLYLQGGSTLFNWFVEQYPLHSKQKLDMGKSCIRFKKLNEIPYSLIGELMQKISVDDWINQYETQLKAGKS